MQKTSKKAKDTAAGTNILTQKAKVPLLFPPPPCLRKFAFYTRVHLALTEARGVPNFLKIISHVPCQCYSEPDVLKEKQD